MGSYFRGENLSDFELDELNSGNDSGNDNNGMLMFLSCIKILLFNKYEIYFW